MTDRLDLTRLASLLTPFTRAVRTHVRRLYHERQARQMPLGDGTSLFDRILNQTLARLCDTRVDDGWWQNLLRRIGHPVVTPEFLRQPALQAWLAQEEVQVDLKKITRQRIIGANGYDWETRKRLRRAFAEHTGRDERLADRAIVIVVAVLTAGYLASIDTALEPVAGLIQTNIQETTTGFQRTEQGIDYLQSALEHIGPDHHVVAAHSKEAAMELSYILKRRALEPVRSCEEIIALTQRVGAGDLRYAQSSVRADILYWAARLHTSRSETLPIAKGLLMQLRQDFPAFDMRIVDALIWEKEGNVDDALRALRDVDSSDGRATLFTVLYRVRAKEDALAWFDEQPGRDNASFMAGLGWCNTVICLAQKGRWEESVHYLAVARQHEQEWPYLVFVEGVINAAMLLPGELRLNALEMNLFHPGIRTIEGQEADQHRARADACFARAAEVMNDIDLEGSVQAANAWQLWLRLTDPKREISEAARQEVQTGMKDGRRAAELLPFARAFEIIVDEGPLKHYLAQRTRLGGLKGHELTAELLLAETTMPPRERADFLEREEKRLSEVVPKAALTGMRVEALVADGRAATARRFLEGRGSDLGGHDYERLCAMITAHEGGDPRTELEALYQKTNSLIDLRNLVRHLGQVGNWTALRSLLEELFERERTIENACALIDCMKRDPNGVENDIVALLEASPDLVDRSSDLASAKAWALLRVGCLKEARVINDCLLLERNHPLDLQLDINLALQSGDWERFPVIIEREWPNRDKHEPTVLMHLASLAAEADATPGRAVELARLAVSKAPNDPHVLVNAYALTTRLGREGKPQAEWLYRAFELSSDRGPVWQVNVRTMIEEMIPAHRERAHKVNEDLLHGKLPLHMATAGMHASLSHVLMDLPHRNMEQRDGRRRVIVPIVSGVRPTIEIQPNWTVGLDTTSLMVLAYLDLLPTTLTALGRVALAPDTMILLLNERRDVRFHQPLRVQRAEEVRELIDQGRLTLAQQAQSLSHPPQWLVEEVGRGLAEMLESARSAGGCVVRPYPIYKPSTFMEREAELRDYGEIVLSTTAFAHALRENGYVDAAAYEHAWSYLLAHDRAYDGSLNYSLVKEPVYLDDLAITYLQEAGLLRRVCNCGLDVRVHPSTRTEQDALIAANREGQRLAAKLDDIRLALREALEGGKVVFLPRRRSEDEETLRGRVLQVVPLAQFLEDLGPCDTVCIDDRFFNKHMSLIDRAGRSVPAVCVLDILYYLERQTAISPTEKHAALHRLRNGGFALIPIEADELELQLREVNFDQDAQVIERAELRVLRQTVMRIRSLDMIDLSVESPFLGRLGYSSVLTIRRIWEDLTIPREHAVALCDWVWRNLAPSPLDWASPVRERTRTAEVRDAFVQHLGLLLTPMLAVKSERHEAFRNWIEQEVLEPLVPANISVLDALAALVGTKIEVFTKEFADGQPAMVAEYLCNRQPVHIRTRLIADESFAARYGLLCRTLVTVGGVASMDQQDLLHAARRAVADCSEQLLTDVDGREIRIAADADGIVLKHTPAGAQPVETRLNELMIVSPCREERRRALKRLLDHLGPAAPEFAALCRTCEERQLNDQEVNELLAEMANGITALQARLVAAVTTGCVTLDHLVPKPLAYFERFCGPDPGDMAPEEYLTKILPVYRKDLLRRDLAGGLDICLLGALRDDLAPGSWTEHLNDDELWNAMDACNPLGDPFSLLGALDVALSRQDDGRYRAFAEEAVRKLAQEEFRRPDGVDTYELLPLLAELILNRMEVMQGCAMRPPYWKRMCAWMQAALVVRLTLPFALDLDRLREWVSTNEISAGVYAKMLDLQKEPMYRASEMSRSSLREEIVGRLVVLRSRHQAAGQTIPRAQDVDAALTRLADRGSPIGWALSGPLEGHCQPAEIEARRLPEDDLKQITSEFTKNPVGAIWSQLALLSQYFDLGEDLLARGREAIGRVTLSGERTDRKHQFFRLLDGSLVAAAQRDAALAGFIAATVLAGAPDSCLADEAIVILQIILVLTAAFENDDDRAEWLRDRLAEIATELQSGEAVKVFLDHVRELKKVLPVAFCVCSRAEAIASAAN